MTQPLFTYDEADILPREDGSRNYVGISAIGLTLLLATPSCGGGSQA